jgi:MFS transporter, AAHS family, 3-hydroxyphenylpropionic acid transporter
MRKTLFILFLWFSGIVAGMQFAKFSAAIGLIQAEVGISPLYSGWLLSSLGIIGIIFGVTSGVIVSRFSPVKMVIVFLWWAAAASFLQAMFSQPGIMLAVRLLEGFSQLILVSAAPTALLIIAPKRYQAIVMTLWGTFFGAAFLAMNVLQGLLIQWGGWKGIFYGHALFSALVALVLLLFVKITPISEIVDRQNHNKISFISQHKSVYKETGSLLPGLLFCCHTLMYLVFLTYLPQRFNHSYPMELLKGNFLQISMPFFSLFGTFLSGVILNKIQKSPLVLIQYAFCSMVVLCTLLILDTGSVFFLSVASIILLCAGVLQGAIFATIPYLSDDSTIHAYANGAITQMGNIGTTVGPPLFSTLLIYFGWNIAFIFPVISSLAGISIIFTFRKKLYSAKENNLI